VPSLPERKQITHDFLIAGEGAGDQALLQHLCSIRGIAGYQFENFGGIGNLES
jgi:hypothetical protein